MNYLIELYKNYHAYIGWLPEVMWILFAASCVYFLQQNFFNGIQKRSQVERNIFLNTVIYALERPIAVAIWGIALVYIAVCVREFFKDTVELSWVDEVYRVLVILTIAWVIKRLISRLEQNLVKPTIKNRKAVDKTTALAISRLSYIALAILTTLVIMQTLSIDVAGIITLGSAGTLVLGIAAKDMLANFFGGFLIFTDRPFKVSDWVRSPDKNIEGVVEHIGWRNTTIRTFDKTLLYIPNSSFLTMAIENPSRMSHRRIRHTIGLRYLDSDKIPVVTKAIEQYLQDNPEIDSQEVIISRFIAFSESTLDCQIICFSKKTDRPEYMRIQQEVLLQIAEIVKQHGAEMAFPTRTIEMVK